ncbi:MAG: zf-HC2 domain-containing protein [candidate division KSB1 bacterium]|nr:zf-HC2 domain-containing protein [candidate division KSB1 bacterium]
MKCEIENRDQLIDYYLAGELSPAEREKFEEHCFNCDVCFQELRFRGLCVALIRKEGAGLFADYLARQRAEKGIAYLFKKMNERLLVQQGRRWIYATATVGIIFLVVLFSYKKLFVQAEQQSQIVIGDNTAIIEQESNTAQTSEPAVLAKRAEPKTEMSQAYAMNFRPLPYLEAMIDDVTRSFSLTVLSPRINEKLSGNILFRWAGDSANVASLKILNNRGAEIFATEPEQNQFIFKERLAPGLYYWKLESKEEVVYVGKFLVE